ncbi:MAG: choice-of-anchor D domain-containing protein [Steroidobacteraceae bacterium]
MTTTRSKSLVRTAAKVVVVSTLAVSLGALAAKGGKGGGGGGDGGGGGGGTKLPVASVSATSLDFGSLQAGESSSQTVTLSNSSRINLNISSIAVTGSAAFSSTNDCPATLAAKARCRIQVTFAPTVGGAAQGSLVIDSNASNSPTAVALAGFATQPPTATVRVEGAGDSIMRGYNADCLGNVSFFDLFCYGLGDQNEHSFLDGWDADVNSIVDRYKRLDAAASGGKAASASGSEMRGGGNNFATQAANIVASASAPATVFVELGGNDLCNRSSVADLYTDAQWESAVRAGLDTLTNGLPDGSSVLLVSVPRVQDLRAVGVARQQADSRVSCTSFWAAYEVCRIATAGGTDLAARTAALDERQNAYNRILGELATEYNAAADSTGVEVVSEYDPVANASAGSFQFQPYDISGGDCFHPSLQGQNKIAELVWGNNPYR